MGSGMYKSLIMCLLHSAPKLVTGSHLYAEVWRPSSLVMLLPYASRFLSYSQTSQVLVSACQCSAWFFVKIAATKLWFFPNLTNLFHISEK